MPDASGFTMTDGAVAETWPDPDVGVLLLHRRPPPVLPLDVFGRGWRAWIEGAARAAACPPDYVAAPLLASVSALIGNARWAQATPGWAEPPHLWCGAVGDSGGGKSPGSDALMRDLLPVLEDRMSADFPDRLRNWKATAEAHAAAVERWKAEVRDAQKKGSPPPLPPIGVAPEEPQAPRLRQNDVTIEKVASLLAGAAPKGLLVVRDELAGWLLGMNSYNDAGRAFWIEAYGGRPYRVERQKSPQPIEVPRLAVAVTGGTQPEKLAALFKDADDGLLARFCWFWPDPVSFALGRDTPATAWATDALDRLRLLDLSPGISPQDRPRPIMVPLAESSRPKIEAFACEMQERQREAGGLMHSSFGKARGTVLRLALVLEYLWWCAQSGMEAPPAVISDRTFLAAAMLVADYLMPMAERVYGDAARSPADRNAATLARWIKRTRPKDVHVRDVQREARLSGLTTADAIHAACRVLVEAGWLREPHSGGFQKRARQAYAVNPALLTTPT
jgi:hypothetical protein